VTVVGALPRLCVVTDRKVTGGRSLVEVVGAALEGGARLVQLREKDLEGGSLFALCEVLFAETRRCGARLLVNDRIDVALAAGADGVVLPANSFPTGVARSLLGEGKLLARSTHSAEEVARAAREGVDFVFFGPVFETPSKAAYGAPQGIARLEAVAALGVPVFAIGGFTSENAAQAVAAGAHGVAVIREVMSAPDPRSAASGLLTAVAKVSAK
jgi:thiamine-phosphate pyrophosphorylase